MANNITISGNGTTIEMPVVKDIEVGGSEVGRSRTMASGRIVRDIVGIRPEITAKWDYVPAETISALTDLLRASHFVTVTYPAPEGEGNGVFDVAYPTLGIFAFKNGTPIWHDVKLSMTGQEVL